MVRRDAPGGSDTYGDDTAGDDAVGDDRAGDDPGDSAVDAVAADQAGWAAAWPAAPDVPAPGPASEAEPAAPGEPATAEGSYGPPSGPWAAQPSGYRADLGYEQTTAYQPGFGPAQTGYEQAGGYEPAPGYQAGFGAGPADPAMEAGIAPAMTPPPTTNIVLPPVRMPRAEPRVAINLLGALVGLLLVGGGLILLLLFNRQMLPEPGRPDVLAVALTIAGCVVIAVAALLAAWASWGPILPGLLLTGVSVWAMVTVGPHSGSSYIAGGTRWLFSEGQLAALCANGTGLTIGLLLLLSGVAAVLLRAGVRRTIREQLESVQ